ncbi:hypothetical protein CJ203_05545 [Corynebacterium tuscaniense]|uniref:Uncharacterized protein n=1 Tax=Corynebacterium tuscaniense TaxID=302449 RepID=A0A2N6T590_9CORY|nr:hypothetical protein [Corynebacterium tuscaniense]PMC64472.1 hypothetical protein CJ203_05545 [Corynebacterium tuscaniense]
MKRVLAALGCLACLAGIYMLGLTTGIDPNLMGDQLGPDNNESAMEYAQRSQDSLAEANEPAFALVTFSSPLAPADAATLLRDVRRVNQIIVADAAPITVGEMPDRTQVFGTEPLIAVVVWEEGDVLRSLVRDPRIAIIDVLPPDAVWGTFGIRVYSNK